MAGTVIGELIGVLTLEDQLSGPLDKIAGKLGVSTAAFGTAAIGVGVFAAAIGSAVAAITVLGNRGAEVGDVQQQFAILSQRVGETGDAMINALRKGTVGAVADFELMKAANKALGDGLRVSADDMETLATGSRLLAKRIGGDTTDAFDKLTTSMARGQTRALTQLGIYVDQEKALQDYAKSIGKADNQLSDFDKRQALQIATMSALRQEIGAIGVSEADFGEKLEALNVRLTNFIDNLSVAVNDSPVLAEALDGLGEVVDIIFGGDGQSKIRTVIDLIEGFAIWLVKAGEYGVVAAQAIYSGWKLVETIIYGLSTALAGIFAGLGQIVTWMLQAASKIPGIGKHFVQAAADAQQWTQTTIKTTNELAEMTAEAAKGVIMQDAMSDKLTATRIALGNVAERMEKVRGTTAETNVASNAFNKSLGESVGALKKVDGPLDSLNKKIKDMQSSASLAADNGKLEFWAENNSNALRSLSDEAEAFGVKLPEALQKAIDAANKFEFGKIVQKAMGEAGKQAEEQVKKSIDFANKRMSEGFHLLDDTSKNASDLYRKRTLSDYDYQVDLIRREQQEKIDKLKELGMATEENLATIESETREKMEAAKQAHNDAVADMMAATNSWGNLTRDWLAEVPDLIQKAFTGGGGLTGAAKALVSKVGSDIGSKLFEAGGLLNGLGNKLTAGATKMFGSVFGNALGLALPGIGGVVGSLVGPLLNKLFGGPSKEELAGRDSVAKIEAQLNGLLTAQQKVEAGGEAWKGSVIAVRDAYKMVGMSEVEAQRAVEALWAASKKGPEAVAAAYQPIQAAIQKTQDAQNLLNSTISKYHFTTEELGPALQRQEIAKKMEEIYSDWTVLNAAQIDSVAIIREMGGKVNDFVQQAIRTGTEVPEAMRPMLDQMAKAGQLTDANGNAITDLGEAGINFSMTMTEGFKMVADTVKDLTDVIRRQLGLAVDETANRLRGIPRTIDVDVHYNDPGFDRSIAPDIPIDPNTGEPGRASGSPGTMFESWGRGTNVTLHGEEAVVNRTQGETLADMVLDAVRSGQGQSAPSIRIENHFEVSGVLDENGLVNVVERKVAPILLRQIRDNRGSMRTQMREELGVE